MLCKQSINKTDMKFNRCKKWQTALRVYVCGNKGELCQPNMNTQNIL